MKRHLIILATLVGITACNEKQPIAASQTDNTNFVVDTLFTKDGCTVYRFLDGGHNRYFVKCGNSAQTTTTRSCGKGCAFTDTTHTNHND